MEHTPVLLKELIYYLNPKPGDTILDATINGGGHAKAVLNAIGKEGKLIGIEQDTEVLEETKKKFEILRKNVILINGNFRNLDELLETACRQSDIKNLKELDGAMFDLGMSSLQLEESGRGFSFQRDEPLLMTYKSCVGAGDLTAKDIVNKWGEKDIADNLYKYGGEKYSRRIAKGIIESRRKKEIRTTAELVEIIRKSVPARYRNSRRINCCTLTFQALRIAVNDEINALNEGIAKAWDLLSEGGRLAVISFHSLEDRAVKNFLREKQKDGEGKILTKKPVRASEEEKKENPRARSAKLRAIERVMSNE